MPTTRPWIPLAVAAALWTACGDDQNRPTGLSAGTHGGTSAPATSSTGPGGTTADPGATTSDVSPTTGAGATDPPCAELTVCTGPTSQDPEDSGDPTGSGGDDTTGGSVDPGDPCSGASDGPHCGGELGGLADHNSLYQCSGGAVTQATPCPAGCEGGACKPVQQDPCASAQSGDGLYCGGTLMGGDASTLYGCQGGQTASETSCAAGCKVNPPGIADACEVEGDPCSAAASGDGAYCGSGLPGGDPNDLYVCQGQATASKETCASGCQVNAPGVPDACKPPANGGECCVDVPPGAVTQSFSACGKGGEHYGIDYGTAVGTPIYAGISGTVTGHALGYPNCYNQGCSKACWNAFNYVKLRSDCGDPNNAANDLYIYYLHVDSLPAGIADGVHVDQGQLLAFSGNSGCSSGPHIHIETVSVPKGQGATLNTCKSEDPKGNYCP